MTDSEKLDKLRAEVAEIKGSINTLAAMHGNTAAQVSKLEGRVWGLLVAVLGAFGTAILSLVMAKSNLSHVASAAREVLAALIQ